MMGRRAEASLAGVLLAALICAAPIAAWSADPLPDSPNPNTRLMRAIWRQDHAAVIEALNDKASPNYIAPFSEFKTGFGTIGWAARPERLISALSLAARLGDLDSMKQLIDDGADLNLHARADQSNLPATTHGLEMAKLLLLRGYRPTAQDISSALELYKTAGWEEWSLAVLTAPGVPQRLSAIRAGIDPDYQKLAEEQADDEDEDQAASKAGGLGRQVQAMQESAQAALDSNQLIGGASIGDKVCSKTGIYHTRYVAYIESRNADRVLLKIVGGYRNAGEFHSGEMHWDDAQSWVPCNVH